MNSLLRGIFLVYFITHIPITLLVDLQGVFGHLYPSQLQDLVVWYVATYNDYLMGNPPYWFKSFIVCELLFQMPFFFVATYGLLAKKNWIRIPSIVYGAHVTTTVIPILAEFVFSQKLSDAQRLQLFGFYAPYLLIPLLLTIYMCFTVTPFPSSTATKKKN